MPSLTIKGMRLTGKWNIVPFIKGAVFVTNQTSRQTKDAAGDLFGVGLGVSSDTMVVGAYNVNNAVGLAHIYSTNGTGGWDFVTDLALTPAQQSSVGSTPRFGTAVAVSGNWIAVTAPGSGNNNNGAVFMYQRVDGVWQTTASQQLTSADTATTGTTFGYSVAIDGTTMVVGHREGNNAHGAAHIFVYNGTKWVLQQTLLPSTTRATLTNGSRVGWSVAVSGNRVIAGGPGNTAASGLGIAIVSTRTGTTWSAPTTIAPDVNQSSDGFGASVAIKGGKYVVGTPSLNTVYVFGGTIQQAKMNVGSAATSTIIDGAVGSARVGWSVDANDDCTVVFAGAPLTSPGATYVFESVDGVWGPSAVTNNGISKLVPSPATINQRFGWAVSYVGGTLVVSGTGQTGVVGATYTFK